MGRGEDQDARSLLGDTFTYGEARQMGLGDKRIYGLRDRGDIIALGAGVYRWSDSPSADLDLIEISERVPMATICLETALARYRRASAEADDLRIDGRAALRRDHQAGPHAGTSAGVPVVSPDLRP